MVYNVIISLVYTSTVADRHFNWYCTELIDFGPMLRLRTWVWTGLGTWLWFLKWILNFLRNLVWNFENSVFINFFITDSNPWQLSAVYLLNSYTKLGSNCCAIWSHFGFDRKKLLYKVSSAISLQLNTKIYIVQKPQVWRADGVHLIRMYIYICLFSKYN